MWVQFLQAVPRSSKMKPIKFENILNREQVICDNVKDIKVIDGVQYLVLHKPNNPRTFMMRKDTLRVIKEKKTVDHR
jgi:hypothetical protein